MSTPRLRRHTDGRLAQRTDRSPCWPCHVTMPPGRVVPVDLPPDSLCYHASDEDVSGEGWSALAVVELPEPDGEVDAVDSNGEDTRTPYWKTSWGESVTAWIEGVETPIWELQEDLDAIRSDAAKMLAAIATCEQFRARRHGSDLQ